MTEMQTEAQRLASAVPSRAPDDPIMLRQHTPDRQHGQHRTKVQEFVRGNADGSDDPHAEWNLTVAKAMTRVLLSAYPGHFWEVGVDRGQGIAWITIPLLLGNWKYIFKLSKDILPQDIVRAGGEILERFNIPRSGLDIAAFINAKKLAVSRASHVPPGGLHKGKA
jgi:hypothetical protein